MKSLVSGVVIALAVAGMALLWASGEQSGWEKRSLESALEPSAARPLGARTLATQRGVPAEESVNPSTNQEVLERLSERVAALEARLAQIEADDAPRLSAVEVSEETASIDSQMTGKSDDSPPSDRPWFHGASLEKLGFTPGEVERIRETWEYTVMEGLELETERLRNGENGWWAAVRDRDWIEGQAREALGDSGYDAMLYAGGSRNRVILSEVIGASPGAAAGIEAGDELIRYDGQRVFHPRTLKQLTTSGEAGEMVEVQVRRRGQPVRIFMPRGPIGARIVAENRAPLR